eukprot:COSAG02_NODE_1453_length_12551_cov_2.557420_2_plen_171_part_00
MRARGSRDSRRGSRDRGRDRDTPAANIKSPSPSGQEPPASRDYKQPPTKQKPAAGSALPGSDKILIKDLSTDVTEESLRHDLRNSGAVANIMLMAAAKPTPCAYVRFVDPADAKKASENVPTGLNGYLPRINTEKGWVVTLQAATKKTAATPPTGAPPRCNLCRTVAPRS